MLLYQKGKIPQWYIFGDGTVAPVSNPGGTAAQK
jgi:hypothetical protein